MSQTPREMQFTQFELFVDATPACISHHLYLSLDASARCVQPLTQETPRPVLTMINLLLTVYVQLIRDRRMRRPCNGYLEM